MTANLLARASVLVVFAAVVAWWDLTARRIPNAVNLAGCLAAVALAWVGGRPALASAAVGGTVYGGFLSLCWAAGLIGGGDAKAGFAFGAFLGMPFALAGLLWGAIAAVVVVGVLAFGAFVRGRSELIGSLRQGGAPGLAAVVCTHPVWRAGIPYAVGLAAGSVLAELAALGWL